MKKILIADHYRGSLEQIHAAVRQGGRITGLSLYSPSAFQDEETMGREALNLSFHQHLMKRKEQFPLYGAMFRFPSFVDEILKFAGECVLYDISAEELPEEDDSEKELKKITAMALALDLPEKHQKKMAEELGGKLEDLKKDHEVSCIPSFASSVFQADVRKILQEHVPFQTEEQVHPAEKRRYADSDHQEIEAVVQDMIAKLNGDPSLRFNVICANPSVQTEILDMVLSEYQLPYSAVSRQTEKVMQQRWCALCDYGLHPDDMERFNAAVSCGAFGKMPKGKADAFLRTSLSSLHVDKTVLTKMEHSAYRNHVHDFQQGSEGAEAYLADIREEIDSIIKAPGAKELAVNAFNIVRIQAHEKEEVMAGMGLRKLLSNCLGWIETKDDLAYLLEICRNETGTEMHLGSDQIIVTDLHHPVRCADISYVLGCSEDFYPGFKVRDGLFDEAYTAKVKKFPSMGERLDLYNRELSWIRRSASKELIYSMASADFDGKEKSWYVDLDERISEKAKWPLASLRPMAADPCQLPTGEAEASFMPEGTLVTSVTASERYFNCPMAWFYQYGLKVDENTPLGLDAAAMGTLWHAMMEDAYKNRKDVNDGRSYTDWSEEEIRQYLDQQFDVLRAALPGLRVRINLTEEKMFHHTRLLLKWLQEMEAETVYVPAEAETSFRKIPVTKDGSVQVNGRIDRVDHFGDTQFRIIDYKSGNDKYSQTRFAQGLQTQLVTYMLIYQNMHPERRAAGAWYCHLNPALTVGIGAKTVGRGKKMELAVSKFDEAENREAALGARKMPGVLIDSEQKDGVDETGGRFCAFSSLPEVEDQDTMEDMLNEIYGQFYEGVKSGFFPADPVKGACSFCLLKGICRFKGREKNAPLRLKVVKNDAEV